MRSPRVTRTAGHRALAHASAWPVAGAVLVTVVALVVAGLAGPAPEPAAARRSETALGRTFACPGGIAGASAVSGVAGSASSGDRSGSPTPQTVRLGATEAARGYAVQSARPGGGTALTPCPEPAAQWWFTGLGATRPHTSRVVLANPRDADALVDVEVLGPRGPVDLRGLRGLAVRHGQTRVLDLARVAPVRGELAVHVTTSRGLVSAVATDSFASAPLARPMQEWVAGTDRPRTSGVLTGLPNRPDDATLVVANPGQSGALVRLRVVGERGTFALPGSEELRVPAGGVAAFPVGRAFDGHPAALLVDADRPVTAAVRIVTDGDLGYTAAGPSLRRPSVLGVPTGTAAEVRLTATDGATRVRVTGYDASGRRTGSRTVSVARGTTSAAALRRGTRAVLVEAAGVPVAAGLVVRGAHGASGAAFPDVVSTAQVPVVRPE